MPELNSGVYLHLDDESARKLKITDVHLHCNENRYGLEFSLAVPKGLNEIRVDKVIAGSIRTIRDYRDSAEAYKNRLELARKLRGVIRDLNLGTESFDYDEKTEKFTLTYRDLTGKNVYQLSIGPVKYRRDSGKLLLKPLSSSLNVQLETNVKPISAFSRDELLNDEAKKWLNSISDRNYRAYLESTLNALSFLVTRDKLMAGSWRYLTYFGRDTMLTAMMLDSIISDKVKRVALQSVLDRSSDRGEVAHEEDIGEQAVYDKVDEILEARDDKAKLEKLLKELDKSVYDYKMVDDDFMLPILTLKYLKSSDNPKEFLEHRNERGETNLESILRNFNFVLSKAGRYDGFNITGGLVKIRDGYLVGDWRDSENGLGYGKYPVSVNVGLVRYAIGAVKEFLNMKLVSRDELRAIAEKLNLAELKQVLDNPSRLEMLYTLWESTDKVFKVKLSPSELRTAIRSYLEDKRLFSEEEREYFLAQKLDERTTLRDFIYDGKIPEVLKDGIEFLSLSLDESGKPVKVMNSDISFKLFNEVLPPDELDKMLKILELPYPIGLRTPVGIVVANPAYTDREELKHLLGKGGYHGSVVWAWQDCLIGLGLIRQLKAYRRLSNVPAYRELIPRIEKLIDYIASLRQLGGDVINQELWTYQVKGQELKPARFGGEDAQTEANPIQLWSTAWLAFFKEYDEVKMRGDKGVG